MKILKVMKYVVADLGIGVDRKEKLERRTRYVEMLIYKKELLNHTGIKELKLPYENVAEAKENIVKVGLQYGKPHMWYNVLERQEKSFLLICIGTGHEYPELSKDEYIGSEIVYDGAFVWHYFLITKADFEIDEEKILQML